MKTPKIVREHMKEMEQTEAEVRQWIFDQLAFRARLVDAPDPAGWIAFKLGATTVREGEQAIAWAKEAAK